MTDPINLDHEDVPEGWFLVTGPRIANTARTAKMVFRIAQRDTVKDVNRKPVPAGIILREEDREAWEALVAKAEARREREKKYANPLTRH